MGVRSLIGLSRAEIEALIAAGGGGIDGAMSSELIPYGVDSDTLTTSPHFRIDAATSRLEVFGGLGSEKLTNGNFTGGSTGWTLPTGWAYSSNSVSHSSNGTGALSQNPSIITGEFNFITFVVSNLTVGSFVVTAGGQTVATISANGSYSYRFPAISTAALLFTPTNTSRFTIDTVSLKKIQDGTVATDTIGIGGVNTAPSTTKMMVNFSQSNGSPGTTRAAAFNNQGSNTWIDFSFGNVDKAHIGVTSGGELGLWASGGNFIGLYNKASSSLFGYIYPTALAHYGMGLFGDKVSAGSGSTPSSTLQSAGSIASKVKRITSNTTLDDTASKWICDASTASCTGTPSAACSSHGSEGACTANDSHGGCSWYAGSSCSAFDNESGMGTCSGTSGCSVVTGSCSGAGDQSSCEAQDDAYGGSCAWSGTDCSGLDESSCGSYSAAGCTQNYADCSVFNYNESACTGQAGCSVNPSTCSSQGDESSCLSASCTWNGSSCEGDNSSCYGSYYTSCSGTYYNCTGTYNTGGCSGSYGAACTGTASCAGIDDSTSCGAETGCTWSTALTVTLPAIANATDRDYWILNDSSSGADTIIVPNGSETINAGSSYTLGAYRDWIHISPLIRTADCSGVSEGSCAGTSGCTANYSNCSWNSGDSTCSGNAVCTGIGDQGTCEGQTYYNGCSGTYTVSKNWYKFGS
jgi:hypothetical protein